MLVDKTRADNGACQINTLAARKIARRDSGSNRHDFAVGDENILYAKIVRGVDMSTLKQRQVQN